MPCLAYSARRSVSCAADPVTGTVPDSVEAMARDESVAAQRTAVAAYAADKDPSYRHLEGLRLPVLVVKFLPSAELILYPDADHGAHLQYLKRFVRHTRMFPDEGRRPGHCAGDPVRPGDDARASQCAVMVRIPRRPGPVHG